MIMPDSDNQYEPPARLRYVIQTVLLTAVVLVISVMAAVYFLVLQDALR
jgi:amino acid permease